MVLTLHIFRIWYNRLLPVYNCIKEREDNIRFKLSPFCHCSRYYSCSCGTERQVEQEVDVDCKVIVVHTHKEVPDPSETV